MFDGGSFAILSVILENIVVKDNSLQPDFDKFCGTKKCISNMRQ
jgi:hypothetical protein